MTSGTLFAVLLLFSMLMQAALAKSPLQGQEVPREEAVIWATGVAPVVLNPAATAGHAWRGHIMYPSLFFQDQLKDQWIPYLTESWKWVEPYVFEIKLRSEARWSDGKPVTAEDVVFMYELGKKYEAYAYNLAWLAMDSVEAVDETTVRFVSSEEKFTFYNFFAGIGSLSAPIYPKHRWESLEEEWGAALFTEFKDLNTEEHITAGPYTVLYHAEDTVIYVRDDNWWGNEIFGLPTPKHLVLKVYTDPGLALEAGDVDVASSGMPDVWKLWVEQGLKRSTYYSELPYHPHLTMYLLFFNWEKEHLRDPELKMALAHAIPYDDIAEKVYNGYATKPESVLPVVHTFEPAQPFIKQELRDATMLEYDLAEAARLLDEAGYVKGPDGWRIRPGGEKLTFSVITPNWAQWMGAAELIVSSFQAVDVDATLEILDFGPYWDRIYLKTADWEVAMCWDAGLNFDYPWIAFRYLMDPRTENFGRLGPIELMTEVVSALDAIPKETDADKVKDYFHRLQEIWVELTPAIPLYYPPSPMEYNEEYWVGWPTEDFHSWWWSSYGHFLPILFALAPSGEEAKIPDWITESRISSLKFLEELQKVIEAPPTPVTVTATRTATITATTTAAAVTVRTTESATFTQIVTTMTSVEVPVADITITAVTGVVVFVVGLAIGGLLLRRRPRPS